MRYFLLGYMGVGKSTIGKKLASLIGLKFIDLDLFIGREEGMSPAEIIENFGELKFRELERKNLKKVLEYDEVLISTGGGTPCYFSNLEDMNDCGTTIYLEMPAKSLVNRLKNAKEKRPLLKGKTEQELSDFISFHLSAREKFYNQAHLTIPAINLKGERLKELAQEIQEIK